MSIDQHLIKLFIYLFIYIFWITAQICCDYVLFGMCDAPWGLPVLDS
jgi:hypothetical protein